VPSVGSRSPSSLAISLFTCLASLATGHYRISSIEVASK
jgi:hypothetical protein